MKCCKQNRVRVAGEAPNQNDGRKTSEMCCQIGTDLLFSPSSWTSREKSSMPTPRSGVYLDLMTTDQCMLPWYPFTMSKVELGPSISSLQKHVIRRELPWKLQQLSCWLNLGHLQLTSPSSKIPKFLFVFNLFKALNKMCVDLGQSKKVDWSSSTTEMPPTFLPFPHCLIAIALDLHILYKGAFAVDIHCSKKLWAKISSIYGNVVPSQTGWVCTNCPRATRTIQRGLPSPLLDEGVDIRRLIRKGSRKRKQMSENQIARRDWHAPGVTGQNHYELAHHNLLHFTPWVSLQNMLSYTVFRGGKGIFNA